jgi:hypothetical protein
MAVDTAAGARASMAVYADPDFPWSILLQADLDRAPDPVAVRGRMADLAGRYPHLGPVPQIRAVPAVGELRESFAGIPYRDGEPLVRVAVGAGPPGLLLAAHHGAVDGLGLLALLGAALGEPVRSDAAGAVDGPPGTSFAVAAARRAAEALVTPPTRLWRPPATRGAARGAEVLVAADLPRAPVGSAALTAAGCAVTSWWNRIHGAGHDRIVAAVGASRRGGAQPRPEHMAALFRLRLPPDADRDLVRALLRSQPREPDFPTVESRLAAFARRLLARRLGATFLASNLGVVHAGATVRALAFYPVDSGPAGVAFGAVSTATTTTVTVRARDFPPDAVAALLDRLVGALPPPR